MLKSGQIKGSNPSAGSSPAAATDDRQPAGRDAGIPESRSLLRGALNSVFIARGRSRQPQTEGSVFLAGSNPGRRPGGGSQAGLPELRRCASLSELTDLASAARGRSRQCMCEENPKSARIRAGQRPWVRFPAFCARECGGVDGRLGNTLLQRGNLAGHD